MIPPDKIYVIHYTKLKERINYLIPILESNGIPFEIITVHDKEDLGDINNFPLYSANPYLFDKKIRTLWDSNLHKFRYISPSEVSCAAKHIVALEKLAVECPNYGLILEDDVIFSKDFAIQFIRNFDSLHNDWDVVFIGEGCGSNFISQKIKNSQKITDEVYKIPHPASNTSDGYLIKPQMASKIVSSIKPFNLSYDWEFAYQMYANNANVYWMVPPLVFQGSKNGSYESHIIQ